MSSDDALPLSGDVLDIEPTLLLFYIVDKSHYVLRVHGKVWERTDLHGCVHWKARTMGGNDALREGPKWDTNGTSRS